MDFNIIAVDFDGTLCENKWPEIGEPNNELIAYLKKRQEAGDKLILWTCRVGEVRDAAVAWSAEQGLTGCKIQAACSTKGTRLVLCINIGEISIFEYCQ